MDSNGIQMETPPGHWKKKTFMLYTSCGGVVDSAITCRPPACGFDFAVRKNFFVF